MSTCDQTLILPLECFVAAALALSELAKVCKFG